MGNQNQPYRDDTPVPTEDWKNSDDSLNKANGATDSRLKEKKKRRDRFVSGGELRSDSCVARRVDVGGYKYNNAHNGGKYKLGEYSYLQSLT